MSAAADDAALREVWSRIPAELVSEGTSRYVVQATTIAGLTPVVRYVFPNGHEVSVYRSTRYSGPAAGIPGWFVCQWPPSAAGLRRQGVDHSGPHEQPGLDAAGVERALLAIKKFP